MFRDQSQKVSIRAQEGKDIQSRVRERSSASRSAESSIISSPKIDEDQGVISFFATNFMGNDNLFIAPDDLNQSLKVAIVNCSMQAVGAMALACLRRDSHFHRKAQERYGTALLMLSEAWKQDSGLEQDSTLISVLFLSFFELLASFDTFQKSWLAHIRGLGGLLQRREQKGVRTFYGVRISVQAQSQVVYNALQTRTAVPDEIVKRSQLIRNFVSPLHQPSEAMNGLLIRLATLQASHNPMSPSKDLFDCLVALDYDISLWADHAPTPWTFSMQSNEYHSGQWWDARCDIYSTRIVMYTWNKARAARLIIHDLIAEQLAVLGPAPRSQDHSDGNTSPTTRQLITDICATIPLFYRPLPDAAYRRSSIVPDIGSVYWLLWPLEIVGSMKRAPSELKHWVLQCLDRMYETTGVVKAQSVAKRLRAGQRPREG